MAEQLATQVERPIDEAIGTVELMAAAATAGCVAVSTGFALGAAYYEQQQNEVPASVAHSINLAVEETMQDFFVDMSAYSLKAGVVCMGIWGLARIARMARLHARQRL